MVVCALLKGIMPVKKLGEALIQHAVTTICHVLSGYLVFFLGFCVVNTHVSILECS